MQCAVNRAALLTMCQRAMPLVPTRSSSDILFNFYIAVDGDQVTIKATNLEAGIEINDRIASPDSTPGSFLVNAAEFKKWLDVDSSNFLTLKTDDTEITVTSEDGTERTFPVQVCPDTYFTTVEYPDIDLFKLPLAMLQTMLANVGYAVAEHNAKYAMEFYSLEVQNKLLTVIATDTKSVPICRYGEVPPLDTPVEQVLVQDCIVNAILASDPSVTPDIHITHTDTVSFIKLGGTSMWCRKPAYKFPPWRLIKPLTSKIKFNISAKLLRDVTKRCALAADTENRRITYQFGPGKAEAIAGAGNRKARIPFPCPPDADGVSFSMVPERLIGAMTPISGDATILWVAEDKPVLIKDAASDAYETLEYVIYIKKVEPIAGAA